MSGTRKRDVLLSLWCLPVDKKTFKKRKSEHPAPEIDSEGKRRDRDPDFDCASCRAKEERSRSLGSRAMKPTPYALTKVPQTPFHD